jgi:lactose/L-arabinose transport system ATP-binding protein
MGFALRYAGVKKDEIERQVLEAARILELEPLLHRRPKELSGGQRQRVAIGRAIVRHPEVFLFDEPLSNLDAELRVHMRIEIARLHKELQTTIIYVTHDQVEAMTLADKIVVLRDGVVEQIGSPLDLYDDPSNQFVAGFIGSPKMNFLNGVVDGDILALDDYAGQSIPLGAVAKKVNKGDKITAGLRPEHFSPTGKAKLSVAAEIVEHLGGETFVYASHNAGEVLTVGMKEGREFKPGDRFDAHFDPVRLLFFDREGERIR